jgi:hypothetical protein
VLLFIALIAAIIPESAGAQAIGGLGDKPIVTVPLQTGGGALFSPDGSFAIQVPGGATWSTNTTITVQEGRIAQSANNGAGQTGQSSPVRAPGDIGQVLQDLLLSRSDNCLVSADSAPCHDPPTATPPSGMVESGAFDVVSTEVSIGWLVRQAVDAAVNAAPLPAIKLGINPDRGLAQLDSWFWIDRGTYAGQPYSYGIEKDSPWTLTWKTIVHHHDTESGPCGDAPDQTCTTSHDWDQVIEHESGHLDTVAVTITFMPAQYTWDFGDGSQPATFSDRTGIGTPYTDPNTPSTVTHKYHFSSAKVFNEGGFLVDLKATWSLSGHVVATRDGSVIQDETRALLGRTGEYSARYQVRESQPVNILGEQIGNHS